MAIRIGFIVILVGVLSYAVSESTQACCPAPPRGKPVVNADQTVIILWDAANKMQHFIRQASFKSDADDFGFLVPSPSEPELDESGNEAFRWNLYDYVPGSAVVGLEGRRFTLVHSIPRRPTPLPPSNERYRGAPNRSTTLRATGGWKSMVLSRANSPR